MTGPPPSALPGAVFASSSAARKEAWTRGLLRYLLHGNQATIYDRLRAPERPSQFFVLCSRRIGKSYLGIVLALETCIRTPNARVLYLAPSAKQASEIVSDQIPAILADCPLALRPTTSAQTKELVFANGSIVRFRGVNAERAEDLRGGFAHLVVLDEAGSMDRLKVVLNDVVRPMTATTDGLTLLLTTPPNSPSHESAEIWDRLVAKGATSTFTLAQAENPALPYAKKVQCLEDAGERAEDIPRILSGEIPPTTTTARREYFCAWESDAGTSVFPEYADHAPRIYKDPGPLAPYRECFVGADWGMKDASGLVFGHFDSRIGKLVIEDEWLEPQAGTPRIAQVIKDRELTLWGDSFDIYRIGDIDLRLLADLSEIHGIRFLKADKKDHAANIELLRSWIRHERLVIHPRCVKLDRQLRNAMWNRRGKDYERAPDRENPELADFHMDLCAALVYLTRYVHIRRGRDPFPKGMDAVPAGKYVPRNSPIRRPKVALHDGTPTARRLFEKRRSR